MTTSELDDEYRFLTDENLHLRMKADRLEREVKELEEMVFVLSLKVLESTRSSQ